MDKIREFDGILDEKDGNVIADQIPVALLRIKLYGKATNIANGILHDGEPKVKI